jgi:hypothetical protein
MNKSKLHGDVTIHGDLTVLGNIFPERTGNIDASSYFQTSGTFNYIGSDLYIHGLTHAFDKKGKYLLIFSGSFKTDIEQDISLGVIVGNSRNVILTCTCSPGKYLFLSTFYEIVTNGSSVNGTIFLDSFNGQVTANSLRATWVYCS